MLKKMLNRNYPGYDIIRVNRRERMVGKEYLMTPFIFRGLRIYLKRSS